MKSPHSSGFLMNPHDVMGFSEVQADLADIGHNAAIVKYAKRYGHCFWHVCGYNPTYAGTAIFSRRRPCAVIFGFHAGLPADCEGRIVTARYPDGCVIMIYAPAKPVANLAFLKNLIAHVNIERDEHKPLVLLGDLNVPRGPSDISEVQSWVESPFDYGDHRIVLETLIAALGRDPGQHQHDFTWYPQPNKANQARKIGMRIDYILHSPTLICTEFTTMHLTGGSDHRPIGATLKLPGSAPPLPPCIALAPLTAILPPTSLPIVDETSIIQQFGRMVLQQQLDQPQTRDPYPNQCAILPGV
jgi:exodeoxyribonuclease III